MKRKNDIYISCVSSAHQVAPKGKFIAIVSSIVETSNPEAELTGALKILGPISAQFFEVSDILVPVGDGKVDGVYISESYDPETHFGKSCQDILSIYKRITGKDLDLTQAKTATNE